MYSLNEENIEYALGNRDLWFLAGRDIRDCFIFYFYVWIRGIYLSLTLGNAKFKTTRLIIFFGLLVKNGGGVDLNSYRHIASLFGLLLMFFCNCVFFFS